MPEHEPRANELLDREEVELLAGEGMVGDVGHRQMAPGSLDHDPVERCPARHDRGDVVHPEPHAVHARVELDVDGHHHARRRRGVGQGLGEILRVHGGSEIPLDHHPRRFGRRFGEDLERRFDAAVAQELELLREPALVERTVGALHGTALGAQDQRQRQHSATADAAEEIRSPVIRSRRHAC